MTRVVVVGGGVGGMVAALRARHHGADVTLVEARNVVGGLASGLQINDMTFDGGPYILLDRERLGWAFDQVGLSLDPLDMVELDPAYRMHWGDGRSLEICSDLEATVAAIEAVQLGGGSSYRIFAQRAAKALNQLAPLLVRPHHVLGPFRTGAWRAGLWAALSLDQVLRRNRLAGISADAVRIWTYIAGGNPRRAPGPLALVPALIHRDGAARPARGIHQVISLLEAELQRAGVVIYTSTPVTSIDHDSRGVRGVTTADGSRLDADVVISDVGGATALLDLIDAKPPRSLRLRMAGPLQSPGITAYLAVSGKPTSEINFMVGGSPKQATAFISGGDPQGPSGARAGRIIAPLSHARANDLGAQGQRDLLHQLVDATWWRDGIGDAEIVTTRLVSDWGREFRLRDDAMNLVMARRQLLLGRLPHRIAHVRGLYLAGSWTHPGQWISFCSVSGVLAADRAMNDQR